MDTLFYVVKQSKILIKCDNSIDFIKEMTYSFDMLKHIEFVKYLIETYCINEIDETFQKLCGWNDFIKWMLDTFPISYETLLNNERYLKNQGMFPKRMEIESY